MVQVLSAMVKPKPSPAKIKIIPKNIINMETKEVEPEVVFIKRSWGGTHKKKFDKNN